MNYLLLIENQQASIESLRQQLAATETRLEGVKQQRDTERTSYLNEFEKNQVLIKQLTQSQQQVTLLRTLVPKRIPNGFVSFGKYYSEQEDKFNDPYNPMCKFKRKYLSDCEEALATTADLSKYVLCEKEIISTWPINGEWIPLYRASKGMTK